MAIKRTKQIEKYLSQMEDIKIFLEDMQNSRQEAYDNKSEKWQEGEKGEEEQENISSLEEQENISSLEDLVNSAETLMNDMENLFEE